MKLKSLLKEWSLTVFVKNRAKNPFYSFLHLLNNNNEQEEKAEQEEDTLAPEPPSLSKKSPSSSLQVRTIWICILSITDSKQDGLIPGREV